MGPQWVGHSDFVQAEIAVALKLGKPIIPILIEGAQLPPPEELPGTSCKPLIRLNFIHLQHSTFHRDVEVLIAGIRQLTETKASEIELTQNAPITVFVSHSTSDRHWVEREIVEFLRANQINPWYSAHSISSAAQWEREILKGMETCEWFSLSCLPLCRQDQIG